MIDKESKILLILISIITLTSCGYIPQLQLCASTDFLNKQITKYGPTIQKQLDTAKIPDISYDDKFDGVAIKFNLTNITQKFAINWNSNVIRIDDQNTFTLLSKNINLTIDSHIQFKIALAAKQKGTLVITIQKMETDTTLKFTQPHCSSSQDRGLGFDVQIDKLYVNTQKFTIKIEGKGIDNLIIKAVMAVLKSRLPSIIQKIALDKGNTAISQITCKPIQQVFGLGTQSYVVTINTTNVPHFVGHNLYAAIDLTFVNSITNSTNNQVQNDNLPEENLFGNETELSLLVSSNMMNTILWIVEDSNVLSINVTNDMLGPNPPIQLDTLSLSILIPGLSKWKKKQVILLIESSSKFSNLYIRNGKLLAALSLSIKFVVNNTGVEPMPVKDCIAKGQCIIAVDLNATLPFSAAIHIDSGNVLRGLVHTVAIEQLKTIYTAIEVQTEQLKKILNTMVGSFRPQINKQIQTGMQLDISALEKFQVQKILMVPKKDYLSVGIGFKK